MNSGFLIFKGVNMRNIHLNPCLGTWLELIHRNGFLCALYSEVYNSKDFSVGFFIEQEILNGSKLFNQEREREKKTLNRLSITIELKKKKLRSKNKHCIIHVKLVAHLQSCTRAFPHIHTDYSGKITCISCNDQNIINDVGLKKALATLFSITARVARVVVREKKYFLQWPTTAKMTFLSYC